MLALALSLVVSAVLFASVMLVFQYTTSNLNDASNRRQQAQTLDAAEGGLNRAYQAIEVATSAAKLPCSLSGTFATLPSNSSYATSMTYFDTFPPSDAALTCTKAQSGSPVPVAAEISSTGTNKSVSKTMEALVKITLAGQVFDQAIFSNQTIVGGNSVDVTAAAGNANFYSNGNVTCANNMVVQGSLVTEGSFSGANNCNVTGSVTAVGDVTLANSTTIGGSAEATGQTCATQGNITLQNSSVVTHNAWAYCSVTMVNHPTVGGTTIANDTSLVNPPSETFPTVPDPAGSASVASQWSSAGYTVQELNDNNCAQNGVYQDIANMSSATTPTVIETSCALSWVNKNTISLNADLAIFSTGGFTMANNTTWQSAGSTPHKLYLIVPTVDGTTTTTCSGGSPGISLLNATTFAATLSVMYFTPCTVIVANGSAGAGQMYAGQVDASNNFSLSFTPLPQIPGSSGGGANGSSMTSVAVIYERQTS